MEALEWIQVLVAGAPSVQNVEDLHKCVSLEDNKEHLALVGEVKEIVVRSDGSVCVKPCLVNK